MTAFAGARSVLDGALSGSVNIHSAPARSSVAGHLELANATRSGKALNIPMALDLSLVEDSATGKIQASQLNISAGKLSAKGSGEYDMTPGLPPSMRNSAFRVRTWQNFSLWRKFLGAPMPPAPGLSHSI